MSKLFLRQAGGRGQLVEPPPPGENLISLVNTINTINIPICIHFQIKYLMMQNSSFHHQSKGWVLLYSLVHHHLSVFNISDISTLLNDVLDNIKTKYYTRCNVCITWRVVLTPSPFSPSTTGRKQVSGVAFIYLLHFLQNSAFQQSRGCVRQRPAVSVLIFYW